MPRTLSALLIEKFGTRAVPVANRRISSVGATALLGAEGNPNRFALHCINLSVNNVFAYIDNTVTSSKGIFLGPNGGGFVLTWEEDFELVAAEWWFVASAAASNLLITEILS